MAVIRVDKEDNYTVMKNVHLRDMELSLKAKGLLSIVLSLPDEWDYSISGLVAICKEEKTAIQSTIKELEENRYLTRRRIQDERGKFDYEYTFHEVPQVGFPQTELPCTENPCTENPCTDNRPQLNTNKLNTDKSNTDRVSTEKIYTPPEFFVDAFNSTCTSLPKVVKLTDKRRKKIDARLKTFSEQEILSAFAIAEQSDFLSGRSSNWKASFDWIMESDNNMLKILEGNYSHHKKTAMDRLKEAHDRLQEEIDGYERNPNY